MPKSPWTPTTTQVLPDPSLEKRSRRQFSAEEKLRIITAADACKHGELGALLRREGIYHAQLSLWRNQFTENGIAGLTKTTPGPKASRTPEQIEIEKLKRRNAQLERKQNHEG